MNTILNKAALPYCKGCGHDLIAKGTARALETMGLNPLDVIVVTDIGCHGIIDSCLNTHTIHGLHGRSIAFGAGVAIGIEERQSKIIVFIGDGGSTIGLQHILEAARLNLNMTVVVHNNMLYGMTGGQTSGLTPAGFRTSTSIDGNAYAGYDICALSHLAGAAWAGRIAGTGDISAFLGEAFAVSGFSIAEVIEICPGYGVKFNKGRKLSEIIEGTGKKPGIWKNSREQFKMVQGKKTTSLIDEQTAIVPDFKPGTESRLSIVISGSAGEGVQSAAGILANAAVRSGCHVTRKGSYPVTVGVGFSTAEMVISHEPIVFHGTGVPDAVIITSADGLAHNISTIGRMQKGKLFIDSSLEPPSTGAEIFVSDFRSMTPGYACLLALFKFLSVTNCISPEALLRTVKESELPGKISFERFSSILSGLPDS
jgi:2-oxoglutarate/2-oxoacid ferredoxin oxidoreductase subunit beta